MAIRWVVSSGEVQESNEKQACKGRTAGLSRRSRHCSSRSERTTQSRGLVHGRGSCDDTVVKLLPLVKRVALKLRGHLPAHVELDDLISDGTVGLIDAVRKFDAAKGVTIESYARYRIRGAILDSLRGQDHASRDMRRRMKKVESACRGLERRLGRPAEDAEIAAAMGLTLAKWHERVAELQRIGFEGTFSRIPQEYNRRVDEENLPAEQDDNPFEQCYRREQRDLLSSALKYLTERERAIIHLYYQEAKTMKQIGGRLGIDESRVSQLHSGALIRLRRRVAGMLRPESEGTCLRRAPRGPRLFGPACGPAPGHGQGAAAPGA